MRILHFIPNLSGGGAERQICLLARELVQRGHEVHVGYSMVGPGDRDLPGVHFHPLGSRSNHDPHLSWQVFHLARAIQPDVIQTCILMMDILGGVAARLNGIPWTLRESTSAMAYRPGWKHRLRARIGEKANAVVSNSRGGDEYWKHRIPDDHRFIIPNGLPLTEIDGAVASLPLGLTNPHNIPIVLYVGRLSSDVSARKNLDVLLQALSLAGREQELLGVICGDGPQRRELEELRHSLGLDDSVYFVGFLPPESVWALMKAATVFVSLSAYEGCPNAVMEAMTCGCPLVLSDIPAHREITDENSAYLVDWTDIRHTTNTILHAIRDRSGSYNRAINARRKSGEWSVSDMAFKFEQVYERIRRDRR